MRDWLSPRRTIRYAKHAVWSKEHSGLIPLVSFLRKNPRITQTGMPITEEGQIAFLRASRRAHTVWTVVLVVFAFLMAGNNIVFSANIFANMISLAILALALVEITKYAYFIWHYHTLGSFKAFLAASLRNPLKAIFLARAHK